MPVEREYESEKALARVEKETGISPEQQMKILQDGMAYGREMGLRLADIAIKQEETKTHLINAELADRKSRREYKLASRQLNILEKVLTHHFNERKSQIEGGFRIIDKAIEEGNWDAAAKVFGDMSAMVARSPLAEAIALNEKMKSGKAVTLDDF